MSSQVEKHIPKTLSLNLKHVKAASKFRTFAAEGFVEVVVVDAKNDHGSGREYNKETKRFEEEVTKPKRYQQVLKVSPLKVPGDASSADTSITFDVYLELPDSTPDSIQLPEDEEEVQVSKIVKELGKKLRYFLGEEEIPNFPKKQTNGKYLYRGNEITVAQLQAAKDDMNSIILETMYKFWNAPERWTTRGRTALARIQQKQSGDGSQKRAKIQFITDKLPEDEVLLAPSEWYKSSSSSSDSAE